MPSILLKRLARLEGVGDRDNRTIRVVISIGGRKLDWANSTCKRVVAPNGSVTEIVRLNGSSHGVSSELIDHFVEKSLSIR